VNSKASEDELNYRQTKQQTRLLQNAVDSADAPPTEGELGVYAELDLQLESQLAKWRDVLSKDIPALNDAMQKTTSRSSLQPWPRPTSFGRCLIL